MKKTKKRLELNRETLNKTQLDRVAGGSIGFTCITCLTNCQPIVSSPITHCCVLKG